MSITDIISKLEANKGVFDSLLSHQSEAAYLCRPQPDKWCLLEIVCHLLDEEREDFKARVKHTLYTPLNDLVPIDPQGWVTSRDYLSKNYNDTLLAFLNERDASVNWLKTQIDANWDNILAHPTLGDLSAKQFLVNWLAHDYLHIRQITKYQYLYLKTKTGIDLQYAGNW